MAKMLGGAKSPLVLLLLLLAGGVAGSAVGAAVAPTFPFLKNFIDTGLQTIGVNLGFFSFNFSIYLQVGPVTAFGLILGYLAYRKL